MDKAEIEDLENIEDKIELVHTKKFINKVKSASDVLKEEESDYTICPSDNYECSETFNAAKLSAAVTVTGLKRILDGKNQNGYCIVRPPGHHSFKDKCQGFCFFNNVSIAAKVAKSEPYNVKKICIFDWDIHHGDGT